jgi:hypothetical protein
MQGEPDAGIPGVRYIGADRFPAASCPPRLRRVLHTLRDGSLRALGDSGLQCFLLQIAARGSRVQSCPDLQSEHVDFPPTFSPGGRTRLDLMDGTPRIAEQADRVTGRCACGGSSYFPPAADVTPCYTYPFIAPELRENGSK